MDVTWDGVVTVDSLTEDSARLRAELSDAAKAYNWKRTLDLLQGHRDLVNSCRPNGRSLYSPLHQAAHGGANADVVRQLVELGAWRTLLNSRGERPVDVAERRGHRHLQQALEPELKHSVPIGVLLRIQLNFHEVIGGRIDRPLPKHGLRLPELQPLLELESPRMWFPVPGMYGGFNYWLESAGAGAVLISESWSRVAGGSGQRHEITSAGTRLVDEGFV